MQLLQRNILTVSISLALLPALLSGCNKPADTAGSTNTTSTFGSSTGAETATSTSSSASSSTSSSESASTGSTSSAGASTGAVDSSLPKVKVDASHNGTGMAEDGAIKYLIAPGKGFALDMGDYAWTETPETKGGAKSVQILIAGQDRPYRVNYVEGTKVYAVEPLDGFKTGQKAMIGIGREVTTDQVKFHPQWIGYLQVQ